MSDLRQLPVPDMEHWSIDQVLAVYDLCQTISATLMHHHKEALVDRMIEIDRSHGHPLCDKTLPLPFDDPF